MQRKNLAANRRDILKKCGIAAGTGIGLGSTTLGATGTVQASNGFDFDLEDVWDALIEILKNKLGSVLSVHDVREMQQEAALIAQTTDDSPRIASDQTAAAFAEDLSEALEKDIATYGRITPQGSAINKIIDYILNSIGFTGSLPVDVCYKPPWSLDGFCLSTAENILDPYCNGTEIFRLPFKAVSYSKNWQGWSGFTWGIDYNTSAWFGWGKDGCLYAGANSSGIEMCSTVACPSEPVPTIAVDDSVEDVAQQAYSFALDAIEESDTIHFPTVVKLVFALFVAYAIILALPAEVAAAAGVVVLGAGAVAIEAGRRWDK